MNIDLPFEAFEEQVRDCLTHLYEHSYLSDHPLAQRLVPEATGAVRVQKFRQMLIDAIETLRPPAEVSFHSRQARHHNILMLRYVERQQAQEVIPQLALSERQFFREHAKAIEMLSWVLREHLSEANPASSAEPETTQDWMEAEIQRIHGDTATEESDVNVMLSGILTTLREIAQQHQVQVVFNPHEASTVQIHKTLLRQVLIWMLANIIKNLPPKSLLSLEPEVGDAGFRIQLQFPHESHDSIVSALQSEQDTFSYLLNTVGARLVFSSPGHIELWLTIQQSVLVIDDNPDIITLFKRYLSGYGANIVSTSTGEQALSIAQQIQPALIILDVMLPDQDGWEVLQQLKNHPSTLHIPVLICSVLEVPDLTDLFGADGYLKKPPVQTEFLNTLIRWLTL